MKHHFLILTGALLALVACSDDEPQKIANPVRPTPDSRTTAPPGSHLKDSSSTDSNTARVTEGDQQKSPSPSPKTGLLNKDSAPDGDRSISGDPTMPHDRSTPADQTTAATAATATATAATATDALKIPNSDTAATPAAPPLATDNSGKNVRDDGSLPTPLDQGNNATDQAITQGIRKLVTDQSTLSVNAKNVKIISQDGVVTLRGPVADAQEREVIYAIALAQPSVKLVNNLLEPLQK